MRDFIHTHRAKLAAILMFLAMIAAQTSTTLDDKFVASANSFINSVDDQGNTLVPMHVVNTPTQ